MLVQILKEKENALYPWKQSKIGHICVVSTKFSFFHQSATCHFFNCQITQLLQRHAVYLWTKHAYYGLLECAQKPSMKVWKGLFSPTMLPQTNRGSSMKKVPFERHRGWVESGFFFNPLHPHFCTLITLWEVNSLHKQHQQPNVEETRTGWAILGQKT